MASMFKKVCKDCGKEFEVIYSEQWKDLCFDCWKIRDNLKQQGLSKEEVEQIRQKSIKKVNETKEIIKNTDMTKIFPNHEGVEPAQGTSDIKEMKAEYEGFVGDTPLVEVLKEIRDLVGIIADIFKHSKEAWVQKNG